MVRSAAMVRPNGSKVRSKYLEHYLRTQPLNREMVRRANASSQANLFQGQIRALPLMLPPLPAQDEFVRIANRVAEAKPSFTRAAAESIRLFLSLQTRAFRGEL